MKLKPAPPSRPPSMVLREEAMKAGDSAADPGRDCSLIGEECGKWCGTLVASRHSVLFPQSSGHLLSRGLLRMGVLVRLTSN